MADLGQSSYGTGVANTIYGDDISEEGFVDNKLLTLIKRESSPSKSLIRSGRRLLILLGFAVGATLSLTPTLAQGNVNGGDLLQNGYDYGNGTGNNNYNNTYSNGYGYNYGYGTQGMVSQPTNINPYPDLDLSLTQKPEDGSKIMQLVATQTAIKGWMTSGDTGDMDQAIAKFSGLLNQTNTDSISGKYAANTLGSLIYNSTQNIANYEGFLANPDLTEEYKKSYEASLQINQKMLTRLKAELGDKFDKEWQRQKSEVGYPDLECAKTHANPGITNANYSNGSESSSGYNECKNITFSELIRRYPHLAESLEHHIESSNLKSMKKDRSKNSHTGDLAETCSSPALPAKIEPNKRCDLNQHHQLVHAIKNPQGPPVNVWSQPVAGLGACDRIRIKWNRNSAGVEIAYIEAFYGDDTNPVPFTTSEIAAFKNSLGLSAPLISQTVGQEKIIDTSYKVQPSRRTKLNLATNLPPRSRVYLKPYSRVTSKNRTQAKHSVRKAAYSWSFDANDDLDPNNR